MINFRPKRGSLLFFDLKNSYNIALYETLTTVQPTRLARANEVFIYLGERTHILYGTYYNVLTTDGQNLWMPRSCYLTRIE